MFQGLFHSLEKTQMHMERFNSAIQEAALHNLTLIKNVTLQLTCPKQSILTSFLMISSPLDNPSLFQDCIISLLLQVVISGQASDRR